MTKPAEAIRQDIVQAMPGAETPQDEDLVLGEFVPYLLVRTVGKHTARLRRRLAPFGLTIVKMRTLGVLSVSDGVQIGELAMHAVVEQSTLSRALDGMERDGLVVRRVNPDDNRAVRVYMTEKGRALFKRIWPFIREAGDELFRGISEEEKATFKTTLKKMLANIDENYRIQQALAAED